MEGHSRNRGIYTEAISPKLPKNDRQQRNKGCE